MDNNIGKKYGNLTVLKFSSQKGYDKIYTCQCDCGKEKDFYLGNLRSGKSKSCGCIQKQKASEVNSKHGKRKERIYSIWTNMKSRCNNPNTPNYNDYGARGITICEEWENDFSEFLKWAQESGYSDDLTIERINFNGDYEPSNCTWIERKYQSRNRRGNRYVTIGRETKTLKEWCDQLEINYKLVHGKFRKGFSELEAIDFYLAKGGRT